MNREYYQQDNTLFSEAVRQQQDDYNTKLEYVREEYYFNKELIMVGFPCYREVTCGEWRTTL